MNTKEKIDKIIDTLMWNEAIGITKRMRSRFFRQVTNDFTEEDYNELGKRWIERYDNNEEIYIRLYNKNQKITLAQFRYDTLIHFVSEKEFCKYFRPETFIFLVDMYIKCSLLKKKGFHKRSKTRGEKIVEVIKTLNHVFDEKQIDEINNVLLKEVLGKEESKILKQYLLNKKLGGSDDE